MRYLIKRTAGTKPAWNWNSRQWKNIKPLMVRNFYTPPEASSHKPKTEIKLQYDEKGIYCLFKVRDRYLRAVATKYQDMVCRDSCAEFFIRPKNDKGYLNFEMNCCGTLLLFYITDHRRTPGGFKKFIKVPKADLKDVQVFHSIKAKKIDPEIKKPTTWYLGLYIPFTLLEKYMGPLGDIAGQTWKGNFFKCGDNTSHPHWASWSKVSELNFHMPQHFGDLVLEK